VGQATLYGTGHGWDGPLGLRQAALDGLDLVWDRPLQMGQALRGTDHPDRPS
jgi:hypothetical protein